jgi:hypothetical protein
VLQDPQTARYASITHAKSGAQGYPRAIRASDTRVGECRDDCRRASGFGRKALLKACLTALLASECSVPGATTIQINISFVLADGLDLDTAWQIPALGLVLSKRPLPSRTPSSSTLPGVLTPRATILISLYSHRRGPYLHRAIMPGGRRHPVDSRNHTLTKIFRFLA